MARRLKIRADPAIDRRDTRFLADGSYFFSDRLKTKGDERVRIITCTAWLAELYDLAAGELSIASGGGLPIHPSKRRFGILHPPFTMAEIRFRDLNALVFGLASTTTLPQEFAGGPLMFDVARVEPPRGVTDLVALIRASRNHQRIVPKASALSLRAKKHLDADYADDPSIARIAAKLAVTHEHLSRQFKRDFGLTPRGYLHQLRMADAPLRLAQGSEIITVSQEVGYNDLTRFYKQFRKRTAASPGVCRAAVQPGRRR